MATATFSTPTEIGEHVIVPVEISASGVRALSESCVKFEAASTSIDGPENLSWHVLYVSDSNFQIVLSVATGAQVLGDLSIDGYVYAGESRVAVTTSLPMTLRLDGRIPRLAKDFDVPDAYTTDAPFDVLFAFNRDAKFIDPSTIHKDATYLDHFIFAGIDMGTPSLYQKGDGRYPSRPIGSVSNTDKTPVGGYIEVSDAWIAGSTYLIRYKQPLADRQGFFDVLLREGRAQGDILKFNGLTFGAGVWRSFYWKGDDLYVLDNLSNRIYAFGITGLQGAHIQLPGGQWGLLYIEDDDFYVYHSYLDRIYKYSAMGVEDTAARLAISGDFVDFLKVGDQWKLLDTINNRIRTVSTAGVESAAVALPASGTNWTAFWLLGDQWAILEQNANQIRFFSQAGVEDTAAMHQLSPTGYIQQSNLYRGPDYWAYLSYDLNNNSYQIEIEID